MGKVLSIDNVRVVYTSGSVETVAVDDVSFKVLPEGLTVILGASGCGKTSLLNVIGGMKHVSDGKISFGDDVISEFSERQLTSYRKDEVGFVFQNYNLIASLTALENVNVAKTLVRNKKDCKSASEMLKLVGLEGKENKYPRQLSGGEQQRVSIARALVKNASMLLCDEPTGALDTHNSKNIIRILQQVARDYQIPVVIVTHNLDFREVASHLIVMENGKIIEETFNDNPADAKETFR